MIPLEPSVQYCKFCHSRLPKNITCPDREQHILRLLAARRCTAESTTPSPKLRGSKGSTDQVGEAAKTILYMPDFGKAVSGKVKHEMAIGQDSQVL